MVTPPPSAPSRVTVFLPEVAVAAMFVPVHSVTEVIVGDWMGAGLVTMHQFYNVLIFNQGSLKKSAFRKQLGFLHGVLHTLHLTPDSVLVFISLVPKGNR